MYTHINYMYCLQVAIRALGFEVKKADVLKILRDYDREGSGKIKFQDFSEVSKSYQEFKEQGSRWKCTSKWCMIYDCFVYIPLLSGEARLVTAEGRIQEVIKSLLIK